MDRGTFQYAERKLVHGSCISNIRYERVGSFETPIQYMVHRISDPQLTDACFITTPISESISRVRKLHEQNTII
ncbi:hypothetical protein Hanom_Chr05g00422811 [Helianthus anomalus]